MLGLSPVPPQRQAPLVINNDRPAYKIADPKGFFGPNDRLYDEGTAIYWDEEPNKQMVPLNEMATERMREYLEKIDTLGRKAAEKLGSFYNSELDAFENARLRMTQEARQVEIIGASELIPLMGAKKNNAGKIEEIRAGAEFAPLLADPKRATPKPAAKISEKPVTLSKTLSDKIKGKPGRPAVNKNTLIKGVEPQTNTED